MATLTTTRYVPPGSYIGQIITPSGGTVPGDIRIPNYIGQGSRLAQSTDAASQSDAADDSYGYDEMLKVPCLNELAYKSVATDPLPPDRLLKPDLASVQRLHQARR